jgi:hypothetical protein
VCLLRHHAPELCTIDWSLSTHDDWLGVVVERHHFGKGGMMSHSAMNSTGDTASGDGDSTVVSNSALRTVIQLTLRTDLRRILGGCPIEQSGLRENLRTIGAHARRHQLQAEQLLVLIKDSCTSLPEARELIARPDRAGTMVQLIAMAIEEYYRVPRPTL